MAWAQFAEAVRRETAKHKAGVALGYNFKHCRSGDRAGDLEDNVGNDIAKGGSALRPKGRL